jgi:hypothetical protein
LSYFIGALMDKPYSDLEGPELTPPAPSSISHAPAVAFHHFSDGLTAIWWGFVLNLAGVYPLVVFLVSLSNPRHMTTTGSWLAVALLVTLGVIIGAVGVKERGYQPTGVRIFGLASLSFGILLMLVPLAASLLYAYGVGR